MDVWHHPDLSAVSPIFPLEQMDHMFHNNQGYARTILSSLFFTVENLQFLVNEIGQTVGRMLGEPGVVAVLTVDFYNYVAQLVSSFRNYADPYYGLSLLNTTVLNHEIPIHYRSLRQRQLFIKWAILQDHPKYLDPPQASNGRRLTTPLSSALYGLADPKGRYYTDALRQIGIIS